MIFVEYYQEEDAGEKERSVISDGFETVHWGSKPQAFWKYPYFQELVKVSKKKALTQIATIAKRPLTSEHSDYKIVVPEHVETKSLIRWIQWIFKVGQSCTWQCNHGSLRTLAGMFQQLSLWWRSFFCICWIHPMSKNCDSVFVACVACLACSDGVKNKSWRSLRGVFVGGELRTSV